MSTTPEHPIKRAAHVIGSYSALARLLGVTRGAVFQYKFPDRKVPAKHCLTIERATSGAVSRRDLRPNDWHQIWPELSEALSPPPAPNA